jgi:C-terminal processing protease CtpA/Prc
MILEPQSSLGDPLEADMSGINLMADGRDFKTFRVDRVFEKTPAAEAGLREGDVIQAIDGRPAAEYTLEDVRGMFKRPASDYTLTILRSDQKMALKIKTRRLV